MNPPALDVARWPRRRWIYAVTGVLALQAALVFAFGKRGQRPPDRPIFRTSIVLLTNGGASATWLSGLDDPALLALPTLDGFSGSAWMKYAPLEYEPAEWSEPPHWLGLDPRRLGATFATFVQSNAAHPQLIVDKPLPLPRDFTLNYPNEPVAQESRLRIEGELASRRLVKPILLKSWPYPDMLSNSVVEAVVDAEGFTFSTVLLGGSGSREADNYALKTADEARFEAARRTRGRSGRSEAGPVAIGKLVFEWHTLPPLPEAGLAPQP